MRNNLLFNINRPKSAAVKVACAGFLSFSATAAFGQGYQLYSLGGPAYDPKGGIDNSGNVAVGGTLFLANTTNGNTSYSSQDFTTVGNWPNTNYGSDPRRGSTQVTGISKSGPATGLGSSLVGSYVESSGYNQQGYGNYATEDTFGWAAGNFGANNSRVGFQKIDPGYYGGTYGYTYTDYSGHPAQGFAYRGSQVLMTGINSSSTAVGHETFKEYYTDLSGTYVGSRDLSTAFVYNPNGGANPYTKIDDSDPQTFDIESTANAINENGLVTGRFGSYYGNQQAYIFNSNTGAFTKIGSPAGGWSEGYDINDLGHVVGEFSTGNARHAMLYNGGSVADLVYGQSYDQSRAMAINNAGMVVGQATVGQDTYAAIFSGGKAINLNTLVSSPNVVLTNALDINEDGWILATGFTTYTDQYGNLRRTDYGSTFALNPSAELRPGGSEMTARMPTVSSPGAFGFTSAPSGQWFDPPMASGFKYGMEATTSQVDDGNGGTTTVISFDTLFTQIKMPSAFSDMLVYVGEGQDRVLLNLLDDDGAPIGFAGDTSLLFSDYSTILGALLLTDGTDQGVGLFSIESIDPRANTENPLAFPLQIWFSNSEAGNFTMTALDVVDQPDNYIPEPAGLSLVAVGATALLRRRRVSQ